MKFSILLSKKFSIHVDRIDHLFTFVNTNIKKKAFTFRGKDQAAKDIAGRFPISHHWDSHDPKLVVTEAQILPRVENKDEKVKPRASLTKAIEEGPVSCCAHFVRHFIIKMLL